MVALYFLMFIPDIAYKIQSFKHFPGVLAQQKILIISDIWEDI